VLMCLTVLVLGLGVPTTPSYIIAAAIGVPQLLELGRPFGVDMLQAHLFIFYFAVIADATPPVAASAFAAAAIAKASPTIASVHASRFGIAGFTVGFAFLYDPGIMLRGGVVEILFATSVQVIALILITSAYAGYLLRPMGVPLRILLGTAGLFGAFGHAAPDMVRLGLSAAALGGTVLMQLMMTRKDAMVRPIAVLFGLMLAVPAMAQAAAPGPAVPVLSAIHAGGDASWSQPDRHGAWQGDDVCDRRAMAAVGPRDPDAVCWRPPIG